MSNNALQDQLHDEIDARFGRKKLDDISIGKIEIQTEAFQRFAHAMAKTVPAGRDLQTALTHLETAKFFANQAIARAGVAE